jgi:GNAT superfamily N-acetyltransferase
VVRGGEAGQRVLEAGLAELARRGLPGTVAIAAELAAEFDGPLRARGGRLADPLRHELIELAALPDPSQAGIAIGPATNATDFEAAFAVLAGTFRYPPEFVRDTFAPTLLGVPELTIRIARVGGEPAAVAVTHRREDLVYVVIMGTEAAFRRRGIGRELLVRALESERGAGGRWAHLVSSEVGAYLYRSVGFRRIADHPTYIVDPGS